MPPVRTSHGKKNTAFKPPSRISDKSNSSEAGPSKPTTVPRSVPTAPTTTKTAATAQTRPAAASFKPATTLISSDSEIDDIDDDDNEDDDDDAVAESVHRRRSTNATAGNSDASAADVPAASDEDDADDDAPPIPPKLLNRLLHEGFADEDMRIGKEAMAVAGKYVETFVREALARAVFEREEAEREGGGVDDGFLQVEDLEKLAPQLLLDF